MSERSSIALVTGGSGALGRAIALRLAQDGFTVAVHFRSSEVEAQRVVDAIVGAGGDGVAVAADLGLGSESRRLVADVVDRFGRIDVLVNAVGIIRDALLMAMEDDQIDDVLSTNLRTAMLVSRAAAEHMVVQRQGVIVNLSSAAATSPRRGHSNYVAAKAGLEGFTRAVAIELGAKNVRVNAVAPGIIDSPMTEPIRSKESLEQRIVLGRLGRPEDVAAAVSFLASDQASYITGQILRVDGGGRIP